MTADKSTFTATNVELIPYLLNRLSSELKNVWMEELRPRGLTIPRWQVMSILSAFDGSRIGTITELTGTEQSVMSRVIGQMERDGLCERRSGEDDSRAVHVHLTRAGRDLFSELQPAASRLVRWILRGFSQRQAEQLARQLESLLSQVSPPPGDDTWDEAANPR